MFSTCLSESSLPHCVSRNRCELIREEQFASDIYPSPGYSVLGPDAILGPQVGSQSWVLSRVLKATLWPPKR